MFDPAPSHASRALLAEQAMTAEGEIVLRRSLAADGKSRAFINDEAVGVGLLKELGGLLLEVHGQSDDRGLFDVATHRGLLDAFGGLEDAGPRGGRALCRLGRGPPTRWPRSRPAPPRPQRNADYVRAAAAELSDFAPEAGEEERLAGERALMMNASRIAEDLSAASEALSGERGAEAALAVGAEEIVAPAGRSPQARRRRGSRAGTGLRPDRGSAARAGRPAGQPGHRYRRAGKQGRTAVRAARAGAQICHARRMALPARAGGFPGPARGAGRQRQLA